MKKTIAMILVLAMLFSLCACSNDGSQTPNSSNSSPASTETSTGSTEKPAGGTEGTTGITQTPSTELTEDEAIREIVLPDSTSKLGKDLDYKSSETACYINVDGMSNKPKVENWGNTVVVDSVADYLDYLESLGFMVEIINTTKKEPYSGFYVYETTFKVSNEHISWTMYLCIQDEKYVEYQFDINLVPSAPTVPSTQTPTTGVTSPTRPSNEPTETSFDALVSQYSGRWYLDGYSDVYLVISLDADVDNNRNDVLHISANNFAVPTPSQEDGIIYPGLQGLTEYFSGLGIIRGQYHTTSTQNQIRDTKISFNKECINIGSYKFIRAKGTKDQHAEFGILGDGMEHDYESKVIDATSTTPGYILRTCKVCGFSYNDNPPYYGIVNGVALKVTDTNVAYCVIGITSDAPANIVIPTTYAGLPVVSIDALYLSYGIPLVTKGDPSNIKSISILDNIKKIGNQAFDCCSNLKTIYYSGTVSQWNTIVQDTVWNQDPPAATVICSDGTVSLRAEDTPPSPTNPPTTTPQTIRVNGVGINKVTLNLSIGDTQQLTATVSPSNATNKKVSWASSNNAIATVSSSGVVTAKSKGTATISVKTSDGGYTASCTVTVKEIGVTGVSIGKTSATLFVGETLTLSATVNPSNATNKNATWMSSNNAIATVSSSGVVIAKSKGTATITVKTSDGGYTASCTITVSEKTLTVETRVGIWRTVIDSNGIHRYVGVRVSPSGGSCNYTRYAIMLFYNNNCIATWDSTKSSVEINFQGAGTYRAIILVEDSSGNYARDDVEVNLE